MSHISEVDIVIKSLDALRAACQRMGWQFVEGQKTYAWWGHWVGDYPLPKNTRVEDLGKCTHAIKVPGAKYEVGVVEMPDGTFTLRYDFYSTGGLAGKLGAGAGLLKQAYGIEAAKIAARRKGFSCYEQLQEDGKTIELVMRRAES
jgi:hypothetical protein